MATTTDIIYKIKERDSSFNITDDYKITDELILSMMNDIRETLIRSELKNNRYIADEYYQFNCCYEIECIEAGCSFEGEIVPDGSQIFTTKLKSHIKGLGDNAIKYAGNRTGTLRFDILSFDDFTSLEGRVWTKFSSAVSIVGNSLRLKNLPTAGMKFICLRELLSDPTSACTWDDEVTDYPVPSVTKLIDMVAYRILTSGRLPSDKVNNAADDTTMPKIQDGAIAMQQKLQSEGDTTNQNRR